jgi:predicted GNAT family N-acyltransferase
VRAVESVLAATIRPLRHAVLRPGQPAAAATYPQDDAPDTLHLAAYDDAGSVVGCATFFPESLEGEPAWRLRGMATAPAVRGQGYAGEMLLRGIEELRERGVRLLWCNARTNAVGFYQRFGFTRRGAEFDIALLGPHYQLVRLLGDAD